MENARFEGWYFKQNTFSGDYAIAIIPGRATDEHGDSHAFIQINQSENQQAFYIKFPIEQFQIKTNPLEIQIGENRFSLKGIYVNIKTEELEFIAKIDYEGIVGISRNAFSPSIMGFFGYLPFLECYHEVYSLNHSTSGWIKFNNKEYDFADGKGYIEGDRGTSFPKNWIWIQTNNFINEVTCVGRDEHVVSLMCAIAKVPLLPFLKPIEGLICLLYVNGKEFRFATYNGGKVVKIESSKKILKIELRKGNFTLKLTTSEEDGGKLKAPTRGAMVGIIKENINARIEVELWENVKGIKESNNSRKLIFCGTGINGGFEKNW